MADRMLPVAGWLVIVAGVLALQARLATAADDRNVHVSVGGGFAQEDNLYRLPPGVDLAATTLPEGDRLDDAVRSALVAVAGQWMPNNQKLVLDTTLSAQRYTYNDDLDHTAGRGRLDWTWQAGSRWFGELGTRRERALGGFANTRSLERDLFDTSTHTGALSLALGPRWQLSARASEAATVHETVARQRDDAEIGTRGAALELRTDRETRLTFEYRLANAVFPRAATQNGSGSASDYDEATASFGLGYALTEKMRFEGSVGRVARTYPLADRGNFAGDVWSAGLTWAATLRSRFMLRQWRELKAHLDAEADHFVSTGASLTATWPLLGNLDVALQVSNEDQAYIGSDALTLFAAARNDAVSARSIALEYAPGERAVCSVAYRRESRESDRLLFGYDARSASLACSLRF